MTLDQALCPQDLHLLWKWAADFMVSEDSMTPTLCPLLGSENALGFFLHSDDPCGYPCWKWKASWILNLPTYDWCVFSSQTIWKRAKEEGNKDNRTLFDPWETSEKLTGKLPFPFSYLWHFCVFYQLIFSSPFLSSFVTFSPCTNHKRKNAKPCKTASLHEDLADLGLIPITLEALFKDDYCFEFRF